tara:strand:- start:4234 stop:4809 length:576 start_codon:yes stop_codon:yes gene_type:complete
MANDAEDVERLIHATFPDSPPNPLSEQELVRFWSLDMHWISPELSSEIIESLCQTGWLIRSKDLLSPNPRISPNRPPLGWSPIVRRLKEPPSFIPKPLMASKPNFKPKSDEPQIELSTSHEYPPDWAENNIKTMISWISKESGLTQKEVVRRAQRKRRALGPVTLWFSLALVAREQGLEMSAIMELIGQPN